MFKRKQSKILLKAPHKRNEALYGLLKYFIFLASCITIIILMVRTADSNHYPYYPSLSTQYFNTILSYIIAIVLAFAGMSSIIKRDINERKRVGKKYQKKVFKILNTISYMFVFLILLVMIKVITDILIYDIQSRMIKHIIGKKADKQVLLDVQIISNPDYQRRINIPSGKSQRSIIDPAPYKIFGEIIVDGISHPLDPHCYLEKDSILLKNTNYILKGYDSFLGFKCMENCTLNYRFTTEKFQPISRGVLDKCRNIYRNQQ